MPFDSEQPAVQDGRRVVASGDGQRFYYYTGYPPPLRQVAEQVRTPSGYTSGLRTPDGPALRALPPAWHTAQTPQRTTFEVTEGLPGRVLDLLHRLQTEGTHLPSCAGLAEDIGLIGGAGRVANALYQLCDAGKIYYWHGGRQAHQGQAVLRIVGSEIELRTDRAPAEVHV